MNFFKKLLNGAKILCLLVNLIGTTYIMSYNDNEKDCFLCEQYGRCDECYSDEGNIETSPHYQHMNSPEGYNPRLRRTEGYYPRRGNPEEWRMKYRSGNTNGYRY